MLWSWNIYFNPCQHPRKSFSSHTMLCIEILSLFFFKSIFVFTDSVVRHQKTTSKVLSSTVGSLSNNPMPWLVSLSDRPLATRVFELMPCLRRQIDFNLSVSPYKEIPQAILHGDWFNHYKFEWRSLPLYCICEGKLQINSCGLVMPYEANVLKQTKGDA